MTGAPPPQGHVTAPQGHMTGVFQSNLTGAPPPQGHAYAPPGPNAAAGGYAASMMTPVAPQQFATKPPLPPSNQDLQKTDLGQGQDEDEDPGKGRDSSKAVSDS